MAPTAERIAPSAVQPAPLHRVRERHRDHEREPLEHKLSRGLLCAAGVQGPVTQKRPGKALILLRLNKDNFSAETAAEPAFAST